MFDTLVVIPAHNEEKNISRVLSDIDSLDLNIDILVVNDGSTDRTESVVRHSNHDIISLPYNLGYGSALQTGFKYAVEKGYLYVIQFDGDGQHDPEDIRAILDKLKNDDADIVIGSRFLGDSSFKAGLMKNTAISLFRFLIKSLTGTKITDPTSGLQGLSRRVFSYYSVKGNFPGDYPDADILIHMLKCNYRVCEFPANMHRRDSGKSMHSGLKPIYYFIKVLLSIIVVLLRQKVLREGCEYIG